MDKSYLNAETELSNCNYIKALLMIIVVLCHCMSIYTGDWGPYDPAVDAPVFSFLTSWTGTFHVYGFTLISGYIFYYIKYEGGV